MSEPSTAEVLAVQVTVNGLDFVWSPETGLDPEAVMQLEPWLWTKAYALRFPAAKAGHSVKDLVQEGRIGALQAAQRFNPFHESRSGFFNYAKIYMFRAMVDLFRMGDLHFSDRQWQELRQEGAWPSVASLDSDPLNDRVGTLKATLADPGSIGKEAPGMEPDRLRAALALLNGQDRAVLIRHFGLASTDGEGETFEAIAGDWNLSRQRVQQIEKRAQMRLRRALRKLGVTQW